MSNPNANVKTNQAFLSSGTTALRTWVSMAMLTAIAYVVMYVSKLLPQVFGFLQLDLKDTAICIGGFVFGPLAAAIISIVVALVEMFTVSDTGRLCLQAVPHEEGRRGGPGPGGAVPDSGHASLELPDYPPVHAQFYPCGYC